MNNKENIINFLKKDLVNNLNILYFMENNPIYYLDKFGDSVLLKGTSDKNWIYISCKKIEDLEMIKSKLNHNDTCFAVIEDWMIPVLTNLVNIKWILSTMRLYLPNHVILPTVSRMLSSLTLDDAQYIYDHSQYKDFLSLAYIKERIKNGISSCIRIKDQLIGWALTQDDGAIGFLHVLPNYRKCGYGKDITIDIINKVRNAGKIPFVHIEEDNLKSMNLALNLGFQKNKVIHWFEIAP